MTGRDQLQDSIEINSILGSGSATEAKQDDTILELQKLTGFEIPPHEQAILSYTGSNLTGVVYKETPGGTTVATLTLAYDGSNNLISVTKT